MLHFINLKTGKRKPRKETLMEKEILKNKMGTWEVKLNVACSTSVSFYSFEEGIEKKSVGLI